LKAKDFDSTTIRALAFDLDGTLLRQDKTLSQRTRRVLKACINKGIKLIIATGRAVVSGEVYREMIGAAGPQVKNNGSEVVDMPGGAQIFTHYVDAPPICYAAELAEEMGVYFQVYFPSGAIGEGEVLMGNRLGEESDYYCKTSGVQAIEGDLKTSLTKVPQLIKGLFITDDVHQQRLRSALNERYRESICVVRSSPRYLEVLANGVSKGVGLAHALKQLGLKTSEAVVFGDEENDLPMFATAAFSAAPSNAKAAVLDAATFHIPSNEEDGVAAFLEEKFLP
jgi:Cof subfamily protein (haloacid dehalogenase superfamily)